MSRFGTLRARLMLASVLAVLVSVVGLAVGAELLVAQQLRSRLDASLRQRAVEVVALSVTAPAVLSSPGSLEAPFSGTQVAVEVLDRHGRIAVRSLALGARILPRGAIVRRALAQGRAGFASVELAGQRLRMYAAPIPDAGGPVAGGAVLVAADTADITTTLHRIVVLLVLAGLAAAAVGALAAAILTRRGLRPLTRLSEGARGIARTADFGRRLPQPQTDDELAELARTLNLMMASLDASRRRERRFLADASHELRTPITSLVGNVEFLSRHGADAELIGDLRLDAARLQQLVDDLLTLEREHDGAPPQQLVALGELVAELRDANPRVSVQVERGASVRADPGALRRALANLVQNAEVHGPPGGEIAVGLTVDDGQALLSVSDQGPGLDPEHVQDAFERFWRAPEASGRPGSGLGLAIVRATALRHGGTVKVHGSTITIVLPVASADQLGG